MLQRFRQLELPDPDIQIAVVNKLTLNFNIIGTLPSQVETAVNPLTERALCESRETVLLVGEEPDVCVRSETEEKEVKQEAGIGTTLNKGGVRVFQHIVAIGQIRRLRDAVLDEGPILGRVPGLLLLWQAAEQVTAAKVRDISVEQQIQPPLPASEHLAEGKVVQVPEFGRRVLSQHEQVQEVQG